MNDVQPDEVANAFTETGEPRTIGSGTLGGGYEAASILNYTVSGFSALSIVWVLGTCLLHRPMQGKYVDDMAIILPLITSAGSLAVLLFTSHRVLYRVAQLIRGVSAIFALYFLVGSTELELLLFTSVILEFCIFESYPLNISASAALTACVVTLRIVMMNRWSVAADVLFFRQIPILLPGVLISMLGSFMSRFRENLIDLQNEKTTLETLTIQLARVNTQYQDYAISADESGRSQERLRITHDIHDIVGYTLTNNIMLMETAIEMMSENPLGVPTTIRRYAGHDEAPNRTI